MAAARRPRGPRRVGAHRVRPTVIWGAHRRGAFWPGGCGRPRHPGRPARRPPDAWRKPPARRGIAVQAAITGGRDLHPLAVGPGRGPRRLAGMRCSGRSPCSRCTPSPHTWLRRGAGELGAGRVDQLTRTRRGALDVQAAELRRIERDLHDGAQARLVALSMQLGTAEDAARRPARGRRMFCAARATRRGDAIAELRDLARGIAPPVLADRGLAAAVDALGRRAAIPVEVDVRDELDRAARAGGRGGGLLRRRRVADERRQARARRAGARDARRSTRRAARRRCATTGRGGADPLGGGLTGLRHRVEALDGALTVRARPAARRSGRSCHAGRDRRRVASEAWRAAGCRSGSSS